LPTDSQNTLEKTPERHVQPLLAFARPSPLPAARRLASAAPRTAARGAVGAPGAQPEVAPGVRTAPFEGIPVVDILRGTLAPQFLAPGAVPGGVPGPRADPGLATALRGAPLLPVIALVPR